MRRSTCAGSRVGRGRSCGRSCGTWTSTVRGARSEVPPPTAAQGTVRTKLLAFEELPVPLGDDSTAPSTTLMAVSSSIGVRRAPACRRPTAPASAMVFVRQVRVVQVREDREVDDAQRCGRPGGRLPLDEVLADAGRHHHAAGAQSRPRPCRAATAAGRPARTRASSGTGTARRRRRPAARRPPGPSGTQRSSSMLGSAVSSSTPTRLPAQLDHAAVGAWPADEPPRRDRAAHRDARTSPWGCTARWTRRSACPAGRPGRRGCSGSLTPPEVSRSFIAPSPFIERLSFTESRLRQTSQARGTDSYECPIMVSVGWSP